MIFRAVIAELTDPGFLRQAGPGRYFTSLEGENEGGSIKDRMVVCELEELLSRGELKAGDWIGEISMGSTARSLAFHAPRFGLRCALFVPDFLPAGEVERMRAMGAEVHAIGVEGAFRRFREFCEERAIRPFDQAGDATKRRFYASLGEAAVAHAGPIEVVVGAVGTGHSLLGTAEGIRPRPLVVSAEPLGAAVAGIRNIVQERHGPDDPCDPSLFDERIELAERDWFPANEVATSHGRVSVPDSFRVVLGSAARLRRGPGNRNHFLLGASNRRIAG